MRHLFWLMLFAIATPAFADEKPFFFKKNDRVVFLGDSITEQYQYSTYLELYLTTRFPDWELFFLNAGIGGDTANGGANRFQSHVLDEKPTAVTINFGMNDAGYGQFDPNRNKQYVEKTIAMMEMAKKAGVRVALISPNAVDRRRNPNFKLYVETQKEFYAPLKDIAAKYNAAFADQYAITRKAVERMESDKADKVVPYPDGFHTAPAGGLLMAHAILTELGAPAKVSEVAIHTGSKKLEVTKCKVENLSAAENAISFDRLDESLPLPIQSDWVSILPYVNDLKDLNYYGLKVKGLKQGIWEIAIGGKQVLKASADDLERGVNLGNLRTGPVFDQAQSVFNAVQQKNGIMHGRFRGVILAQIPDWLADVAKERKPQEMKKRLELIVAKQKEIHELAKPKTQHFELKLAQ